jgi:hypothetical protein
LAADEENDKLKAILKTKLQVILSQVLQLPAEIMMVIGLRGREQKASQRVE